MSKTVKKTLIAGAIIACIGLAIVLIIGFTSGWDVANAQWESETYSTEVGEQISNVDLDLPAGSIQIEFYEGETIKVDYSQSKQVTTQFNVTNQTLKISSTIKWHVQVLWFNRMPTTKMYIPQDMQVGLKLRVQAGTVTIGEGTYNDVDVEMDAGTISMKQITCNNFVLSMDAGTMNVNQIQCDTFKAEINAGTLKVTNLKCDDIDLDLSAGSAKLGIVGSKADYTIHTDVSAGSCNVKSQSGGSKRLSVEVSAGSVKVTFAE